MSGFSTFSKHISSSPHQGSPHQQGKTSTSADYSNVRHEVLESVKTDRLQSQTAVKMHESAESNWL